MYSYANKIISEKKYPKPVAGKYYTAENGINLFRISILAYGYDKTQLIVQANTILQSRNLDQNNHPVVFQDDRIWLPPEI